MKRRVDLLVSPGWLAKFFKCEPVEGAVPRFDPLAPGATAGGQLRIPVMVETADDLDTIEGTLSWAEVVIVPSDALALVRRHIYDKAEKTTLPVDSGWRPRSAKPPEATP